MGFTAKLDSVLDDCVAISAIYQEYMPELLTGTSDPEEVIPEMLQRMKDAHLDRIISVLQDQVNEYMAAKQ